jgi:hypothetical protein
METDMLPVMPATSSAALLSGAFQFPNGLFDTAEDMLLAFGFADVGGDDVEEPTTDAPEGDDEGDEDEDEDDSDEEVADDDK